SLTRSSLCCPSSGASAAWSPWSPSPWARGRHAGGTCPARERPLPSNRRSCPPPPSATRFRLTAPSADHEEEASVLPSAENASELPVQTANATCRESRPTDWREVGFRRQPGKRWQLSTFLPASHAPSHRRREQK